MGRMKDFFSESNEEICQKILQYNNTLAERIKQLEQDLVSAKEEIRDLENELDYWQNIHRDPII